MITQLSRLSRYCRKESEEVFSGLRLWCLHKEGEKLETSSTAPLWSSCSTLESALSRVLRTSCACRRWPITYF